MSRTIRFKSRASAAAWLSAGVLMAQTPAPAPASGKMPPPGQAGASERSSGHIFIKYSAKFEKWRGDLRVAGMLQGAPVFRTTQGEFFTVDSRTGDLKFHSGESLGFIKMHGALDKSSSSRALNSFIKFDGIKGEQRVSVAGVDAEGRVIQENSRGERFYLGPNGDMVFVK